jgi:hypothetical protein
VFATGTETGNSALAPGVPSTGAPPGFIIAYR